MSSQKVPISSTDLLKGIKFLSKNSDKNINLNGVVVDSRAVKKNFMYVAIKGTQSDGHDFIDDAIRLGATALVVEDADRVPESFSGLVFVVASGRKAISTIASNLYSNPSREVKVIGVTGTNGKTTTTYVLEHMLSAIGRKVGVLGTIDHHLGQKVWSTELTTPGPLELQARLREMVDLGADYIVMEVSSHSLEQGRVNGLEFDGAIFTNLSRDHLDYHGSMENYFEAKKILFSELLANSKKTVKVASLNWDDEWIRRIELNSPILLHRFGEGAEEFRITSFASNIKGISLVFQFDGKKHHVHSPIVGDFNAYNVLGAISCLFGLEENQEELLESLNSFEGVPGRLQACKVGQKIAFVDYAHTPDALEKTLKSLRRSQSDDADFKKGRIITVFGCGGDRDKGKRPIMFQVADQLSDITIVTSDNPRTESPAQIIKEILKGVADSERQSDVHSIEDRREAIKTAVEISRDFDIILVAGKGHENYQILGEKKFPFSDYQILGDELNDSKKG